MTFAPGTYRITLAGGTETQQKTAEVTVLRDLKVAVPALRLTFPGMDADSFLGSARAVTVGARGAGVAVRRRQVSASGQRTNGLETLASRPCGIDLLTKDIHLPVNHICVDAL